MTAAEVIRSIPTFAQPDGVTRGIVQLHVPGAGQWIIEIAPDTVLVMCGTAHDPDVTITIPAELLVEVAERQRHAAAAMREGLTVEGDLALARKLRRLLGRP